MKNTDKTTQISRRKLLQGTILAGATGLVAVALPGSAAAKRMGGILFPTPPQMEGPFFPETLPIDKDNDLVRVIGKLAEAFGKVTHIGGNVVNDKNEPVPGALVEIWQCDHTGKYNHSGDTQPQDFDDKFQGYGRTVTDENGAYRFRTIKPVSYPGRTPHIHFKVAAEGYKELTSQMYINGETLNQRDGLFMRETPEDQALLVVDLKDAPHIEQNALAGNFRIVLKPL